MLITNPAYLNQLKILQQDYANLPWYKKFWFSLCSYRLSYALAAIDAKYPTEEQVQALLDASKKSWFFKSIFGLLTQFNQAVLGVLPVQKSFEKLPDETMPEVARYLTSQEMRGFAFTSRRHASLFKPQLDAYKLDAYELLRLITRKDRDYTRIEAMIKKDSSFLTIKGAITDYAGHSFSQISPFEYALWTLDKDLPNKLLDYIPNNPEGERIKTALKAQYEKAHPPGVICTHRAMFQA